MVHFTEYFPYLNSNSADQITCELNSLTLPTATVGTSWSLLGSTRNGQAALYLFQKHSLCWEYIYTCSHCRRFLNGQTRLGGACAVLHLLQAELFTLSRTTSKYSESNMMERKCTGGKNNSGHGDGETAPA